MAPVPGDSPKTPAWHIDAVRGPSTPSLDHLVGAGEQRRGHIDAEHPGRWQVDHQIELSGQLDRQIAGLLALEDAAGIDAENAVAFIGVRPIAHQAASDGKLAAKIQCGKRMARSQHYELRGAIEEEWIGRDQHRVGAQLSQSLERRLDVANSAGLEDDDLLPDGAGRDLKILHLRGRKGAIWIEENGDSPGITAQLSQQPQPLRLGFGEERTYSGDVAAWPMQARDQSAPDRVGAADENNRHGRGRRFRRQRRCFAADRDDDRHLPTHEIAREHREPVVVTLSGAVLDRDVAALDETGLIQTLADDRDERGVGRRRTDAEQADYRGALLLRARRERPCGRRAAECSQQFPPSDGDCHTPLPREVRKGNDTTPRACCPNSAAPGAGGAHARHRLQRSAAWPTIRLDFKRLIFGRCSPWNRIRWSSPVLAMASLCAQITLWRACPVPPAW